MELLSSDINGQNECRLSCRQIQLGALILTIIKPVTHIAFSTGISSSLSEDGRIPIGNTPVSSPTRNTLLSLEQTIPVVWGFISGFMPRRIRLAWRAVSFCRDINYFPNSSHIMSCHSACINIKQWHTHDTVIVVML